MTSTPTTPAPTVTADALAERTAFEAWVTSPAEQDRGLSLSWCGDSYCHPVTQFAWDVWQGSSALRSRPSEEDLAKAMCRARMKSALPADPDETIEAEVNLLWDLCLPDARAALSLLSTPSQPTDPSAYAALRSAVEPFIKAAENYADCDDEKHLDNDATITVGALRELRSALSTLPLPAEAGGWLPMHDAPTDGEDVLLLFWIMHESPGGPFAQQVVASWDVEDVGGEGGWIDHDLRPIEGLGSPAGFRRLPPVSTPSTQR